MLQQLIEAIETRRIIEFTYSGLHRLAEPHAVGISRAGNLVLRCFQTHGGHITPGHEWDLCELSKIVGLVITDQAFNGVRTGYRRGDSHMIKIHAQL